MFYFEKFHNMCVCLCSRKSKVLTVFSAPTTVSSHSNYMNVCSPGMRARMNLNVVEGARAELASHRDYNYQHRMLALPCSYMWVSELEASTAFMGKFILTVDYFNKTHQISLQDH